MTPRQERFVHEYVVDLNATQAAIRAGYSPKTAEVQGSRLLRNAQVREAVATAQERVLGNVDDLAAVVARELKRIATADITKLYGPSGNLLPMSEWPEDMRTVVSSVKTLAYNSKSGDGKQEEVVELKTWDKPKALDMLAKHLNFYESHQKAGAAEFAEVVERLAAGRRRVADARKAREEG